MEAQSWQPQRSFREIVDDLALDSGMEDMWIIMPGFLKNVLMDEAVEFFIREDVYEAVQARDVPTLRTLSRGTSWADMTHHIENKLRTTAYENANNIWDDLEDLCYILAPLRDDQI